MSQDLVIIGGGIAGLGASLLLARAGASVTLVERDPGPGTVDGDGAFTEWARPSVPQWRFAHVFASRSRQVLLDRAPDVLDRLRDDGVEEVNFADLLIPAHEREPGDARFAFVRSRRPAFELALRRAVEDERGIRLLDSTRVEGLTVTSAADRPQVRGVRLEGGRVLEAEVVLDCGGRRTSFPKWLAAAGVEVETEAQDCGLTYYTRYFREGSEPAGAPLVAGELGYLLYATLGGDHETYAVTLAGAPWNEDLKLLRHDAAWMAMARAVPDLAEWVEPLRGVPLTEVQVMAGHRSVRRHYVRDGELVVSHALSLGDALCTSNPFFSWGASMALTHAAAAVDAIEAHPASSDDAALAFYTAVAEETDAVYRSSSSTDRVRTHRWRGEVMPEADAEAAEREELIRRGVLPGIRRDHELLRAVLRRSGLIEPPDAIFSNERVMAKARRERDGAAPVENAGVGPSYEDAVSLLADAMASS